MKLICDICGDRKQCRVRSLEGELLVLCGACRACGEVEGGEKEKEVVERVCGLGGGLGAVVVLQD